MPINLTGILEKTARHFPNTQAVVYDGRSLSFLEFYNRIRKLGAAFRALGVKNGDRIAVLSVNSARLMEMFYAPFYADAVFVPMNFRWSFHESLACMNDCQAEILLVDVDHVAMAKKIQNECTFLRHLVYMGDSETPDGFQNYESLLASGGENEVSTRRAQDIAVLFYTGGTTGAPKGVMLTHANLFSNAIGAIAAYGYKTGARFLQVAPMFHAAAGSRVYSLAMAASTSILMDKFTPDSVQTEIVEQKITEVLFVPTMLNMIFNNPEFDINDFSSLRRINYGAAPMPETLMRQIMKKLPGIEFYQGYGMTEASPLATILSAQDHDPDGPLSGKLGSVGKPVYHCDLRVVDEAGNDRPTSETGEVIFRGPNVMKGYWNMPELTAQTLRDGWLHTGDVGYLDKDGYVFIVDRIKDMIVTGGENVYSSEVENIIHRHFAIKECAVIGIPDDKWGEAVHAIVTLKTDCAIEKGELITFCKEYIASYKCPRSIEVVEQMPLSGTGKILKTELRKPYQH